MNINIYDYGSRGADPAGSGRYGGADADRTRGGFDAARGVNRAGGADKAGQAGRDPFSQVSSGDRRALQTGLQSALDANALNGSNTAKAEDLLKGWQDFDKGGPFGKDAAKDGMKANGPDKGRNGSQSGGKGGDMQRQIGELLDRLLQSFGLDKGAGGPGQEDAGKKAGKAGGKGNAGGADGGGQEGAQDIQQLISQLVKMLEQLLGGKDGGQMAGKPGGWPGGSANSPLGGMQSPFGA